MQYLPIMQELFESDTIFVLIAGCLIAIMMGMQLKRPKRFKNYLLGSLALYAICEVFANFHFNYFLDFMFLFLGTLGLGLFFTFGIFSLARHVSSRLIQD